MQDSDMAMSIIDASLDKQYEKLSYKYFNVCSNLKLDYDSKWKQDYLIVILKSNKKYD